ncbi:hypothetical protein WG902_18280 [Ramlibacter sp. PS3R-8]|uniref:hypothetical protein n=1 Tax=Ramlibacter sp. PS3R-8 TaxID=3133437 RepID=UPI003095306C
MTEPATTETPRRKKPLWKRLWGVSGLIEIANEYVSDGDVRYFNRIAPFWYWARGLAGSCTAGGVFTIFVCLAEYDFGVTSAKELMPADLVNSILPSLLGFGIGVYALVFGVAPTLVRDLQAQHAAAKDPLGLETTILSLNASFAFPLVFMTASIFAGIFQKVITSSVPLRYATWFLLFTSLALTFQLVRTLFRLGRNVLIQKLDD